MPRWAIPLPMHCLFELVMESALILHPLHRVNGWRNQAERLRILLSLTANSAIRVGVDTLRLTTECYLAKIRSLKKRK
jgi:hypothetical protein